MITLPGTFEEKMRKLLGEEYESYIACYENPRYYGLRVNTAKIAVDEFLTIAPFPLQPIPWIENGFYYDGSTYTPSKHPYYYAGLYYLQEPSAMTPANRLPVEPGDRVLDVCAAPGGKATELGAKLQGQGVLIANDISNSRAKGLLKNIELFGIGNVLVLSEEPGKFVDDFREYFDKILIDAPCSGEGMFRKEPKMIKAWEEHGPEVFAPIQRGILHQAAEMLRPGGMLLYSTCTFDERENECTISEFLRNHTNFHVIPMKDYVGFVSGKPELTHEKQQELTHTVRIFPHKMEGEGHFLALLQKDDLDTKEVTEKITERKNRKLPEELQDFLHLIRRDFNPSGFEIHGEKVYYMPEGLPKLSKIRFLRTGLLLGEVKKNRFEPSQALAMNLKKEEYPFCIDFPASDDRIIRYLKGETLEVSDLVERNDKGWYLICVDGYPLGWGKLNNGSVKNKYLPGWRIGA